MIHLCFIFLSSFLSIILTVPVIIRISTKFNLYDDADKHRKRSMRKISRLGGISIFISLLVVIFQFVEMNTSAGRSLILAIAIIGITGIKDDLLGGLNVTFKLIMQFFTAIVLTTYGNYRMDCFHVVININGINDSQDILFSVFIIMFMINAFNFLDGIDGLVSSIGLLISIVFGMAFFLTDNLPLAMISSILSGCLAGFLIFNHYPAKIFMGDLGASLTGLIIVTLAIQLTKLDFKKITDIYNIPNPFCLLASVLILPIFDMLRIVIIRLLQLKSPFKGDMNHTHHRLSRLGLNDNESVLLLIFLTLAIMGVCILAQGLETGIVVILLLGISCLLNSILTYLLYKQNLLS